MESWAAAAAADGDVEAAAGSPAASAAPPLEPSGVAAAAFCGTWVMMDEGSMALGDV